jgi:RNA polymerase sigma-70 factor (ECF subfamily)
MSPAKYNPQFTKRDSERVERIRSGDTAAFEALFREQYDFLIRYAYGLVKSSDIAHDIVADVFANIWQAKHQWAPKGTLRAYFLACVRNRAFDLMRHDRRWAALWERTAPDDIPIPSQFASEPDLELDMVTRLRAAYAAIDAMRGRRKEVMVLRWREQLSIAEIAQALEISEASVHTHLSQALKVLREMLRS